MKKSLHIVFMSFMVLQLSAQKPIIYDSLFDGNTGLNQLWLNMGDSVDRRYFLADTTKAGNFISVGFTECKLAQNDYLSYVEGSQLIINSLFQKNKQADFSLFDTQGREIINNVVYFGINTFDVGNLPAAFYLVKVKNQGGVYTQKIFISPSR